MVIKSITNIFIRSLCLGVNVCKLHLRLFERLLPTFDYIRHYSKYLVFHI
jgi:hypothetical protein